MDRPKKAARQNLAAVYRGSGNREVGFSDRPYRSASLGSTKRFAGRSHQTAEWFSDLLAKDPDQLVVGLGQALNWVVD